MKTLPFLLSISLLSLTACATMPDLIQWHDDSDQPDYATSTTTNSGTASSRAPLEVPPELRADLELPMQDKVATKMDSSVLPQAYKQAVAGKAVSLDARMYQQSAAQVFSSVVDAMTALNIPVQSVDSPSGIITSDWIRKGSDSSASIIGSFLGDSKSSAYTKHRFIVRVYRAHLEGVDMTKLEIRVHGQVYINRHWVNKPMNRKVAKELFAAAEEQLGRIQGGALIKP